MGHRTATVHRASTFVCRPAMRFSPRPHHCRRARVNASGIVRMQCVRIGLIGGGMIGSTTRRCCRRSRRRCRAGSSWSRSPIPTRGRARPSRPSTAGPTRMPTTPRCCSDAPVDAVFVCTADRASRRDRRRRRRRRPPSLLREAAGDVAVREARRCRTPSGAPACGRRSASCCASPPSTGSCATSLREPDLGAPMAVVFRDDQCFPIRGLHDTPLARGSAADGRRHADRARRPRPRPAHLVLRPDRAPCAPGSRTTPATRASRTTSPSSWQLCLAGSAPSS